MAASKEGHSEIVALLLTTEGIDVNKTVRIMIPPLLYPTIFALICHIYDYILYDCINLQVKGESPIRAAVDGPADINLEVVVALAEAGADVNQRRLYGNTLLYIASQRGNAEVVSVLLAYNASLTVKNDEGQFPIDVAANDQIRQLINDEMIARFDHGLKRTVFPPLPPDLDSEVAAAAAELDQDIHPDGGDVVGAAGTASAHATAATSVASEDEDSEESSDDDDEDDGL